MAATYDIGDVVRVTGTFKQGASFVDPTTVTLVLKVPDGTSTTYTYALAELIKDSTGVYHRDFSIDAAGTHRYRWTSAGAGQGSEENWFQVRTRRVR